MNKTPAESTAATVRPSAPASVPPLASSWTTNMTASSLTTASGNSCLDEQIERLKRCEYLREGEVKALCLRAREILVDESNVQRVDAPVTVRTILSGAEYFVHGNETRKRTCHYTKIHEPHTLQNMYHIHSHTFPHLLGFSDTNRFVETFTVNSTISSNSSKSAVNVPTKIISSSATLSIGGTTRSKHSYCSSPSRYDTPIGLPSFGATTNHDKLHKYTVSTTNVCANTDRSTSGDTAPKFSTISHYRPLSKTRCLPCTAA